MEQSAQDNNIATTSLPLLEKIAYCESGLNPYALNVNPHTVDKGIFQVNSSHKSEMGQMGLDYDDWRDEITFALHLYQTQGTRPWSASKSCWNTQLAVAGNGLTP